MNLPFDILDHIFGFLITHPGSLVACSEAHPVFSRMVEKYQYYCLTIDLESTGGHLTKLLSCLKTLFLSAWVSSGGDDDANLYCALPAITRLIKTASSIQSVALRFHFHVSDISSLGQLDWSLLAQLQPICPRVELHVSCDAMSRSVSHDRVLVALAGSEVLMDLVNRDVVVLKPKSVRRTL